MLLDLQTTCKVVLTMVDYGGAERSGLLGVFCTGFCGCSNVKIPEILRDALCVAVFRLFKFAYKKPGIYN